MFQLDNYIINHASDHKDIPQLNGLENLIPIILFLKLCQICFHLKIFFTQLIVIQNSKVFINREWMQLPWPGSIDWWDCYMGRVIRNDRGLSHCVIHLKWFSFCLTANVYVLVFISLCNNNVTKALLTTLRFLW